jgi:hypothetical protein
MEKILFSEEQQFRQWWLWVILVASLLVVIIPFFNGIYAQEILGKPYGDRPMSTAGLVVLGSFSLVIMGIVFFVFLRTSLKTKITNEGIFVAYPPLLNKWKKFVPEDIQKYEVRTYKANWEYGGHGMKSRRKYGQSYTVSGNVGLQLYFKNGKRLLIGTQRKQAITYAMEKLMGQQT